MESSTTELINLFPPEEEDGDDDFNITKDEFENFKGAIKDKRFRQLLSEYADEVTDPNNQAIQQKEVRELEKERGNNVHFVNPIAGYVIKTSVDGIKKGFINICTNPLIRKPTSRNAIQNNQSGHIWSIPFAQSPGRDDIDKSGKMCLVYDVIFNPSTLVLARESDAFRNKVEETAIEAVENSFKVKLDKTNIKKPKLKYKGFKNATVIKYKFGENPPNVIDSDSIQNEIPPQPQEPYFSQKKNNNSRKNNCLKEGNKKIGNIASLNSKENKQEHNSWTEPNYSIKYRNHVDIQDCCLDNQLSGRSSKPIPDEIILTIDLPLLSDSSNLEADVLEGGWDFELKSRKKAAYKLNFKLPFQVYPEMAKASFDIDKRKLNVTLKTMQKKSDLKIIPNEDEKENMNDYMLDLLFSSDEGENMSDNNNKIFMDKNDSGSEVNDINNDDERMKNMFKNKRTNSLESYEKAPQFLNGDVIVKSILKRSSSTNSTTGRFRSMSESAIDAYSFSNGKEESTSLEDLNEDEETESGLGSSVEKCVRFSDSIQQQLFKSNSSILGQKKKNQRKSKYKRKVRERLASESSVSSLDEDECLIGLNINGNKNKFTKPTTALPETIL